MATAAFLWQFKSFNLNSWNLNPRLVALGISLAETIGICMSLFTTAQLTIKKYGPDKKVQPWAGYSQAGVV